MAQRPRDPLSVTGRVVTCPAAPRTGSENTNNKQTSRCDDPGPNGFSNQLVHPQAAPKLRKSRTSKAQDETPCPASETQNKLDDLLICRNAETPRPT